MSEIEIKNEFLIGITNSLMALQCWLRPGWLSFAVGLHVDSLRPAATKLQETREKMMTEYVQLHPDTFPEGHPQAGEKNPQAGQWVRLTVGDQEVVPFKSKEAEAEFRKKEKDLNEKSVKFTVHQRLTLADIKKIDEERMPEPKAIPGFDGTSMQVDFTMLYRIVDMGAQPQPLSGKRTPAVKRA